MKIIMKNYLVTGGAGFVGSQLIKKLIKIKKNNIKIYSLDNYSTGLIKNQVKDKNVIYFKGETKDVQKIFKKKKLILFFILVNFQEYTKAFKI